MVIWSRGLILLEATIKEHWALSMTTSVRILVAELGAR
jgi:hypothetical protein